MYRHIYFIGIGGIGMSAIARYYNFKGLDVSGYDRSESELTRQLCQEGIRVHYTDSPELIPQDIQDTLVVYTPAIPEDLNELVTVRQKGYKVVKRSRMLGEITDGQVCLAVSGTHGKTTTSTLAAHILTQSGEGCSAFLGGISKNYATNLLVSASNVVVAEADEFDRSFLQLHPEIAVVTAMDADHLDIYGDLEHVQEAFRNFASQVSGAVIKKIGLPLEQTDTPAKLYTYSLDNPRADFYASDIRLQQDGHFIFDLNHPGGVIKDIRLGTLGWVNVENCVAASAICLLHGTDPESIRNAAESFQGVRRRLDVHVNKAGLTYIDDYAHHPAELATAISSLKQIFPSRTLTGVFQPHLYTRTRDLAQGFAMALSLLDELILLDIYPAREEPIPGVTSEIIFKDVTCPRKTMLHKEQLLDYLAGRDLDVLATFGAGDIDRLVQPIATMLEER
jgi:UDP-N-acetylmuramate--alanine ligase